MGWGGASCAPTTAIVCWLFRIGAAIDIFDRHHTNAITAYTLQFDSTHASHCVGTLLSPCFLLPFLQIAFTTLFGIGRTQAFRLCGDLGLNPFQKLGAIPDADFEPIKQKIESTYQPKHAVLKRVGDNILAKVRMGSYQGLRHQMCLPVHGQRTRSNAKTQHKLGEIRAKLFNIPLLSKKAKQTANAGGVPASGKPVI